MRWRTGRVSDNVEDRRGMRPGGGIALGGGSLLLVLALSLITGQSPLTIIEALSGPSASVEQGSDSGTGGAPSDELGRFAATVLASTEDVWGELFDPRNGGYQPPRLVLFSEAVQSACGFGSAAVGPFYCPADRKVYLDLSFFEELERRFAAPGDFAQAYVIAHEVGHHVQNILGIYDRVANGRGRRGGEASNALSVRIELQADCFAGVWAYHANRRSRLLEPGDIEEGLRAAAAIGDDRLQKQAQGYTVPETWTHGSSEMRKRWLQRGLATGDVEQCDTFSEGGSLR